MGTVKVMRLEESMYDFMDRFVSVLGADSILFEKIRLHGIRLDSDHANTRSTYAFTHHHYSAMLTFRCNTLRCIYSQVRSLNVTA